MIPFGEVAKLGHASFATRDLERLADYYADVIGFRAVERGPDAVHLTSGIDHHTVELHRGEQDGIAHLAFELAAGYGLDDAARQLDDHGVASEIKSDAEPGIDSCWSSPIPRATRSSCTSDGRALPGLAAAASSRTSSATSASAPPTCRR